MTFISIYTDELALLICDQVADGKALRQVCRQAGMPNRDTVRRWLRDRPEFRARYALACELRADAFGEDILEIADNATPENTQQAKLMIDTRKWLMARMAPRRYGDRVVVGGDAEAPPVQVELSPTDLARRIAFTLACAAHDVEPAKG